MGWVLTQGLLCCVAGCAGKKAAVLAESDEVFPWSEDGGRREIESKQRITPYVRACEFRG